MLVHIKQLFANYTPGQFAYPAFNTMNLEITQAIIAAAEEVNAPVILGTSEGAIKYAGLETLYEIMATLAIKAKVPVAMHVDHTQDMDLLKRAIELGYSSVMIDHSNLSFEQNVTDTKTIVDFAHEDGAWVQGEVGAIFGKEDWVSVDQVRLTEPDEALRFYEATGVDTLACSVGTVHGIIKMSGEVKPNVDVARIKAIKNKVPIPLVLHGASGIPAEVIRLAISSGIAIINIDTELRIAFSTSLRQSLADQPGEVDPRKIMKPVIAAVKTAAEVKLREFGTRNIV